MSRRYDDRQQPGPAEAPPWPAAEDRGGYAPDDPHRGAAVELSGAPPYQAEVAVVLLHGRGGSAADMTALAREILRGAPELAGEVAFLAPQARANSWYPQRFLAPLAANEPWLGSALALVQRVTEHLADAGLPAHRVVLLGFSQGACLALEAAARHPRRWGGVVGLTGGLIGPPGMGLAHPGSLAGTPVFLGAGDHDPHVPLARIEESAAALAAMGATVTKRIYPGLPHTIVADELDWVRQLLVSLVEEATAPGPG
jgi:predicted esterase